MESRLLVKPLEKEIRYILRSWIGENNPYGTRTLYRFTSLKSNSTIRKTNHCIQTTEQTCRCADPSKGSFNVTYDGIRTFTTEQEPSMYVEKRVRERVSFILLTSRVPPHTTRLENRRVTSFTTLLLGLTRTRVLVLT